MFARKSMLLALLMLGALMITLTACDTGPNSPRGFSLPAGDAERGKQVFLYTGCLSCHSIEGVESDIAIELETPVKLGGKVTRIKTYGELVTSVINPSHKIAKGYKPVNVQEEGVSKMRNYNDTLTVTQLIDLVTFLETHYELVAYDPTKYQTY